MEFGLISSLTGSQLGSYQLATAHQLSQTKTDDSTSIAQLIAAAQQNFQLSRAAPGIGANLDIIA
jgi:hypothetical protein